MSKDLKDLIDKAEEEQQNKAYLEKTIEKLQLEVDKLKSKLNAQKVAFKPTPIKHVSEQSESEEIGILKDMISSLSQKLEKREEEKEILQDKVKELTLELDEVKESLSDSLKDEMLSRTQNSLNTLIQDYGRLEQENKSLKNKMFELSKEIDQDTKALMSLQAESSKNEQLKNEIINLRQKLSNLERTNKSLTANLDILKTKQGSKQELDKIVETLKINNLELEKENEALNEKLEVLKREKLKIFKLESHISELNKQIEDLKQRNKELHDKDTILLAKTITALQHHDKMENARPKSDIAELKPIVKSNIEEKEEMIFKVKESTKADTVIKPYIADTLIESRKQVKEQEVFEPEEIEDEEESDIARKWQCPKCGNSNKAYIREIDDKTRLIYAYPKIYAKKYKCGQCGAEWK